MYCSFIFGGADADGGGISPVTALAPITPQSKKALMHLVQSPGSQSPDSLARQPSLQRMYYNIPHRYGDNCLIYFLVGLVKK
jgi:hypothetical protein